MHSYQASVEKPCYCDGRPIPPAYQEVAFDKKTLKLSDLADINIIEAPKLAK